MSPRGAALFQRLVLWVTAQAIESHPSVQQVSRPSIVIHSGAAAAADRENTRAQRSQQSPHPVLQRQLPHPGPEVLWQLAARGALPLDAPAQHAPLVLHLVLEHLAVRAGLCVVREETGLDRRPPCCTTKVIVIAVVQASSQRLSGGLNDDLPRCTQHRTGHHTAIQAGALRRSCCAP
jgi:hypothetical protein